MSKRKNNETNLKMLKVAATGATISSLLLLIYFDLYTFSSLALAISTANLDELDKMHLLLAANLITVFMIMIPEIIINYLYLTDNYTSKTRIITWIIYLILMVIMIIALTPNLQYQADTYSFKT